MKSGFLVVFHRDLTITKTGAIPEDGGINGGINLLVSYVRDNPGKRTRDIAKSLNISLRTIERWIGTLKKEDKIEFRGSKKTGGYYLTNADRVPGQTI